MVIGLLSHHIIISSSGLKLDDEAVGVAVELRLAPLCGGKLIVPVFMVSSVNNPPAD